MIWNWEEHFSAACAIILIDFSSRSWFIILGNGFDTCFHKSSYCKNCCWLLYCCSGCCALSCQKCKIDYRCICFCAKYIKAIFVLTSLPFPVLLHTFIQKVDTSRTLYWWVVLWSSSSQIEWEKLERWHWQFSHWHYSTWSINIRIYCFYCCCLGSARENNSPCPSLCHSLYWYVPIHPFSINYLNYIHN